MNILLFKLISAGLISCRQELGDSRVNSEVVGVVNVSFCRIPKLFLGEGPRSRCYGRTAVLRLIVQPYDEDEEKDD
jgi:hypothetical protein